MTDKKEADTLLRAAGTGDLEKVRIFIGDGLDVNTANEFGYTALMSAARSYRAPIVAYLIDRGADPRRACADGTTALHVAVGETPSLPELQAECIRLLVRAGAELDAVTNSGLTPLMNAAWFGCNDSFKLLLDAGASLYLKDAQGRTAEDLAILKKNEEILKIIRFTNTA